MPVVDIQNFLLSVWSYPGVKVIISHVLLNVILAVAATANTGDFTFARLGEFLYRKIAPFVGAYYAAQLFGDASGVGWLAPAVWAIVEANLAANTLDSLQRLGVPIPEPVGRLVAGPQSNNGVDGKQA